MWLSKITNIGRFNNFFNVYHQANHNTLKPPEVPAPTPTELKCAQPFDVPLLPPPLPNYQPHHLDKIDQSTASQKRTINPNIMRSKKFRFLKNIASLSALNETKVDDITTDIIIPRERVIRLGYTLQLQVYKQNSQSQFESDWVEFLV